MKKGEQVFAKRDSGRYHRAVVLDATKVSYYAVYFEDDDTVSDQIDPADVLNWSAKTHLHPSLGQRLEVRGATGEVSKGRHLGLNNVYTYEVQFLNDNSIARLDRKDIYSLRENLMRFFCGKARALQDAKESGGGRVKEEQDDGSAS